MRRVRVSTTVDGELMASARRAMPDLDDASLLDEALAALVASLRAVEIDTSYSAYDERPLAESDAWGDLVSFRSAEAKSRRRCPAGGKRGSD